MSGYLIDERRVVARVGKISILLRKSSGSYYLSSWDETHRRIARRTTKLKSLADARKVAREWDKDLARGHLERLMGQHDRISINMAIGEAIQRGGKGKGEEHTAALTRSTGYFMTWLNGRARHWDEINARLVSEYIEYLSGRGMKPATIAHYIRPLTTAARYWVRQDDRTHRPLHITHPALELAPPAKNHLTIEQLLDCIRLAGARNNVYAMAGFVLGGLAGLRLREIADIRRADFNGDLGMLTVTRDKTARTARVSHSARTIPMLPDVARFLAACYARGDRDRLIDGDDQTVARAMRTVMAAADISAVVPKDAGRKSFMQWSRPVSGVDPSAFGAYVGHSPGTMADKAYVSWTPSLLREKIIIPLQRHLDRLADGVGAMIIDMAGATH